MPKQIKIAIWVVVLGLLYSLLSSVSTKIYGDTKAIYNTSVEYETQYDAQTQNLISTFDSYYLSYTDQYGATSVSKEGFIELAKIAMSARADGANLAWKWVKENQPMPYAEFSSFYVNLVEFTKERYSQVLAIERQRQSIVQSHNKNITVFPNNIYNRYLKIKPIEYKAGYISDSTRKLFNIK